MRQRSGIFLALLSLLGGSLLQPIEAASQKPRATLRARTRAKQAQVHAQLLALKNPAITARLAALDQPSVPAQHTRKPVTPATAAGMLPLVYGDLTGEGVVDLDDLLCVLGAFRGDGGDCPLANDLPLLMTRADLAPCEGNGIIDIDDIQAVEDAFQGHPPCPVAGPSPQLGPDQSLLQDGTASFDATSSTSPWPLTTARFDFGDCSVDEQKSTDPDFLRTHHVYPTPGTYTATLTLIDTQGHTATDTALITVTKMATQPLTANFTVSKLVAVNQGNCEQVWQEIELDDPGDAKDAYDQIESGLRVKFDAISSSGESTYRWKQNGVTFNINQSFIEAYPGPQTFDMTLQVRTAQSAQSSITRTIHVAEGMHLLSAMPYPGEDFYVQRFTVLDGKVWVVSAMGSLGEADLSSPHALSRLNIVRRNFLPLPMWMTSGSGKLFFARGNAGAMSVDAWVASPDNFQPWNIAPLQTALTKAGDSVSALAASGTTLFVGAYPSSKLYVFDIAGNAPVLKRTLDVQGGIGELTIGGSRYLISRSWEGLTTVFDIEGPEDPQKIGQSFQLLPTLYSLHATGSLIAVAGNNNTTLLLRFEELRQGNTMPRVMNPGGNQFVVSDNRLYQINIGRQTVSKYDILNAFLVPAENAYLMESIDNVGPGMTLGFLHDPDGATGPAPEVLMIASPYGFMAYQP